MSANRLLAISFLVATLSVWMLSGGRESLAEALSPAKTWDAVWPLLAGSAIALVPIVAQRTRRTPGGRKVRDAPNACARRRQAIRAALDRPASCLAASLGSAERRLRDWTSAGTCLAAAAVALLYLLRA